MAKKQPFVFGGPNGVGPPGDDFPEISLIDLEHPDAPTEYEVDFPTDGSPFYLRADFLRRLVDDQAILDLTRRKFWEAMEDETIRSFHPWPFYRVRFEENDDGVEGVGIVMLDTPWEAALALLREPALIATPLSRRFCGIYYQLFELREKYRKKAQQDHSVLVADHVAAMCHMFDEEALNLAGRRARIVLAAMTGTKDAVLAALEAGGDPPEEAES